MPIATDRRESLTTSSEILSLIDIASWQFKELGRPCIIAGIPSLQRGAVWKPGQVELLWDSILRGFPIGSLVVCEKLNTQVTHAGLYAKDGRGGWDEADTKYHLLDGQQRCNAIALAFVDALETQHTKMPSATLWIDLDPEISSGTTRQFLFRMLTEADPWGFNKDDAASFLNVPAIRGSLKKYGRDKRPQIIYAWPSESNIPIPFSWLAKEAFINKQQDGRDMWEKVLLKCEEHSGAGWAEAAALLIKKCLDCGTDRNKHLVRIGTGVLNAANRLAIVALKVPSTALKEPSRQGRAPAEGAAGEKQDLYKLDDNTHIYNVEHLFQRLNSAGTELRGEELTFSMIKAYWPGIEQSFAAICDTKGNSFLPMPGSRLATLGARAALIGFGEPKDNLPPPLSIGRLRGIAGAQTEKAKDEKTKLEDYFGITKLMPGEDIQKSDLHQNLKQIDDWLLSNGENDFGIPPALRSSLAQDAPDVFLLLLYLAQKVRDDKLDSNELNALRKPILGLATTLHWFGVDRAKAVGRLYSHFSKALFTGPLSADAFSGVLQACTEPTYGKRELPKLLAPGKFEELVPHLITDKADLSEWTLWKQIVGTQTDSSAQQPKQQDEWLFFRSVAYSRALLLYGQRAFLSKKFSDYDPSCIDIWKGRGRPWDYDHILPSDTLNYNQGKFRKVCREWVNTIGNLRAWPLEENRSRHQELANKSIYGQDLKHSMLTQQECDAFSLNQEQIADAGKVVGFMNAARDRLISIYDDWFRSLDIGALLHEKDGDGRGRG